MKQTQNSSIAIVYDWVDTPYGGAEIVLQAIHDIFPDAPIYTSIYIRKKARWAKNIEIIPSFLQKCSFLINKHQLLLPLLPLAFESFNLEKYDLVISITSGPAKGVITKPNQKHICYMLTPSRYIYSHQDTYLQSKWWFRFPYIKKIIQFVITYSKFWDQSAVLRPDSIIPISELVSKRIQKYYNSKPKKVLYPPVSVPLSQQEIKALPVFQMTSNFYLSLSRLVPYKRVDLSIQSCLKLNKVLVVVGTGESEKELHALAGTQMCKKQKSETVAAFLQRATKEEKLILFTGNLPQIDVYTLLKNTQALLMPGQEDFGITALESGIFGKPVILFYTSGVAELLQNNKHAIHIAQESISEMIYALGKLDTLVFDADQLRANALKHQVTLFKQKFKQRIEEELKG